MALAAVTSPRDAVSGMASGKVSVQDLHFTSRADAVSRCSGVAVTQTGSSFSCSLPVSSDMAINEQGLPGSGHGPVKGGGTVGSKHCPDQPGCPKSPD